jgi:hypothetical protein
MAWKQCFLVYQTFEIYYKNISEENSILSFIIDTIGSQTPGQEIQQLPTKESPGGNNNFPPPVQMCTSCDTKDETQLSSDRDKWPIGKIENGCFQQICELLDIAKRNNRPLMSALDGFDQTMAACIKKEYEAKGGSGTTEEVLGKWGSSKHENNVGALKKILKKIVKRVDVLDVIEKWKKLSVCHGCGIRLNKSH